MKKIFASCLQLFHHTGAVAVAFGLNAHALRMVSHTLQSGVSLGNARCWPSFRLRRRQ